MLIANADSQTALRDVISYYHETFKQAPEAHEYLTKSGTSTNLTPHKNVLASPELCHI